MSNLKDILKSLSNELRKAQNSMFSKKFEEASQILKSLEMLVEEGVALDPGNVQVKTFTNQIAKLKKDLDQRMGSESQPSIAARPQTPLPSTRAVPSAPSVPSGPALEKKAAPSGLPAGVSKRLRDMDPLIARGKAHDVIALLQEIEAQYAGQFDAHHPDYIAKKQWAQDALAKMESDKQGAQAENDRLDRERLEREEISAQWEQRLRSLRPFGIRTGDFQDLVAQETAYREAGAVFSEYGKVEFPYGGTYGLEQIAQELAESLDAFPAFWAESLRTALEEALQHLSSRRGELDKILEGKPAFMSEGCIQQTREFLGKFRLLFPEGSDEDVRIAGLFRELVQKNDENRKERAKLIFIREDQYTGVDSGAIKERMEQFILAADPDAQIVKSSVYKPEWKEIAQWEDYAGNQRFVTRAEINGQVIARIKGRPLLYTVYVTKEKKSDGTWTQLTGNVMFTDEMADENAG